MSKNETIMQIYKYFKTERERHDYCYLLNQPHLRAATACGVCRKTILKIRDLAKKGRLSSINSPSSPVSRSVKSRKRRRRTRTKLTLDCFDLCKLRNIIDTFYAVKKENPTVEKLVITAQKEMGFPAEGTTLRRIIKEDLGYKFLKGKKTLRLLVLKPEVAACRAQYLRRMIQNDELGTERKPVTYLEDTCISYPNSGKACVNIAKKRWFFINAGGDNGFISPARIVQRSRITTGSYHREIDMPEFMSWLGEQILPELPSGGIVVISHALHRATLVGNQPPVFYSPTHEIKKWLRDHSIPFDEDMTKSELYNLISTTKTSKKYAAEELLTAHGHEVLILPPFNWDLSPMQYIWVQVKQQVPLHETPGSNIDVVELTIRAIKSVTASDWQREIKRAESLILGYWTRDQLVEAQQSKLISAVGGHISSNEWDSSSGGFYSGNEDTLMSEDEVIHIMSADVSNRVEVEVLEIYSSSDEN